MVRMNEGAGFSIFFLFLFSPSLPKRDPSPLLDMPLHNHPAPAVWLRPRAWSMWPAPLLLCNLLLRKRGTRKYCFFSPLLSCHSHMLILFVLFHSSSESHPLFSLFPPSLSFPATPFLHLRSISLPSPSLFPYRARPVVATPSIFLARTFASDCEWRAAVGDFERERAKREKREGGERDKE